ncbi:hypothetical protein MVEG_01230 [Podila verticillata NRRL 6337]|nr:hypothetical protein MVEG_01230 [Podila verticillata NRRL 6337]
MTSSPAMDLDVSQRFISSTDSLIASLPTHLCTKTGGRYLLWGDLRDTFKDVDHLLNQYKNIALLMIDNNDIEMCEATWSQFVTVQAAVRLFETNFKRSEERFNDDTVASSSGGDQSRVDHECFSQHLSFIVSNLAAPQF